MENLEHGILPLHEGDEDPQGHWFMCKNIWSAIDVDVDDKVNQMT
jgi:hypothetical protein